MNITSNGVYDIGKRPRNKTRTTHQFRRHLRSCQYSEHPLWSQFVLLRERAHLQLSHSPPSSGPRFHGQMDFLDPAFQQAEIGCTSRSLGLSQRSTPEMEPRLSTLGAKYQADEPSVPQFREPRHPRRV